MSAFTCCGSALKCTALRPINTDSEIIQEKACEVYC
uniref:Uncharacterized protein n=1 Tax=Anguilla anguilla TaxID=7936 RepID=A0A0E9UEH1_ANGAN